jgi:DDE domain
VLPAVVHSTQQHENNRAEVSHQPTRRRERQMRRFKSTAHAQRFLCVHGLVRNLFRAGRHLLRAAHHRLLRTRSFLGVERRDGYLLTNNQTRHRRIVRPCPRQLDSAAPRQSRRPHRGSVCTCRSVQAPRSYSQRARCALRTLRHSGHRRGRSKPRASKNFRSPSSMVNGALQSTQIFDSIHFLF